VIIKNNKRKKPSLSSN